MNDMKPILMPTRLVVELGTARLVHLVATADYLHVVRRQLW